MFKIRCWSIPVIEILLFCFEAKYVFLNPFKDFQNTTRRSNKVSSNIKISF